jgi:hypothetical protein
MPGGGLKTKICRFEAGLSLRLIAGVVMMLHGDN